MNRLGKRLVALVPGYPACDLCVAFSGGLDSVVLLTALQRLPRSMRPRRLRALHVDHHLNPHSGLWRAQALRIAGGLGIRCQVLDARVSRVRGTSLEAEARRARYALLARALGPGEVLLTAHHLDDQAETILLQLLRGAGVAGLAAMPERVPFGRGWLVRPLLEVPRAQIERWARAQDLSWVDDDSNADARFDRNFLRHRVLPLLRERWPSAAQTLARSARHLAEAQRLLDRQGALDAARASDGAALAVATLRALPPDRRRNALRFWLRSLGLRSPDATRLQEIAGAMLAAREDALPRIEWAGASIERHAGRLTARADVSARSPEVARPRAGGPLTWQWQRRRRLELPGGGTLRILSDRHGDLDLGRLPAALELRFRCGGEKLMPRRGGARRTLKALLREARLVPAQRTHIPLLCAGETLLAVGDLHLDASVQADSRSVRRGRLVWERGTAQPRHSAR